MLNKEPGNKDKDQADECRPGQRENGQLSLVVFIGSAKIGNPCFKAQAADQQRQAEVIADKVDPPAHTGFIKAGNTHVQRKHRGEIHPAP